MVQRPSSRGPDSVRSQVLPFRGGEGRVPSSVFVRQALETHGESRAGARAGMAVAAALGESLEDAGRGGQTVARASAVDLSERSGLSGTEVSDALQAMEAAELVERREPDLFRLDPNLLCTLPALAALRWTACRGRLHEVEARLAPALGVLREIARLSRRAGDGAGEWLQPTVQELAEETLYGRTAVTQALGDLTRAGLVEKAEQPARNGLKLRLTRRAFEGAESERTEEVQRPPAPSRGAEAGVVLRIGGAEVRVPAGSRLDLPEGINVRLEIAPDGTPILRAD